MGNKDDIRVKSHLEGRMSHKKNILREGGEQSLSHSKDDIIRIKKALERLRTGSYGECIDCGTKIPQERLTLIPEAERCILCQNIFEKKLN
ncbi:MAG: TraR/DksA C4-type zinc finger protein [Candidatus Pacebacteria bacterium]|nr:TraR/DksA C4-type zinc finger protein [Candidatus Paceibacterota bacterium]MBP9866475.1 TraR/DksA C4-type zinc finger protein [Candidatus Paceibacterota bacterium]